MRVDSVARRTAALAGGAVALCGLTLLGMDAGWPWQAFVLTYLAAVACACAACMGAWRTDDDGEGS